MRKYLEVQFFLFHGNTQKFDIDEEDARRFSACYVEKNIFESAIVIMGVKVMWV